MIKIEGDKIVNKRLGFYEFTDHLQTLILGKSDEELVSELTVKTLVLGETTASSVPIGEIIGTRLDNQDIVFDAYVDGDLEKSYHVGRFTSLEDARRESCKWIESQTKTLKDNLIGKDDLLRLLISEEELQSFSKKIDLDIPYSLYLSSSSFASDVYTLLKGVHSKDIIEADINATVEFVNTDAYNSLPEQIKTRLQNANTRDLERIDSSERINFDLSRKVRAVVNAYNERKSREKE